MFLWDPPWGVNHTVLPCSTSQALANPGSMAEFPQDFNVLEHFVALSL